MATQVAPDEHAMGAVGNILHIDKAFVIGMCELLSWVQSPSRFDTWCAARTKAENVSSSQLETFKTVHGEQSPIHGSLKVLRVYRLELGRTKSYQGALKS